MDHSGGGIVTVVVAALTVTAGVLAVVGVGPSGPPATAPVAFGPSLPPAGTPRDDPASTVAAITTTTTSTATTNTTTSTATTVPAATTTSSTSTVAPATTTTSTSSTSTSSTSTSSTSTSTTSTTGVRSTTTPPPARPPLVPASVEASANAVGVGGSVSFTGTCVEVEGRVGTPLVVWVIGDAIEQIVTGAAGSPWRYEWTAPTDPARIRSYAFQFWCGDPGAQPPGYPLELQRTVDMVASAPPAPTPRPNPEPRTRPAPGPVIPATD